jgi:hypothetical protein
VVPLPANGTDADLIAFADGWAANAYGEVGEIWYDLNIDGVASDLTSTFRVVRVQGGLVVRLNDIHVM